MLGKVLWRLRDFLCFFPKGRGLPGGSPILAKKLCCLYVVQSSEATMLPSSIASRQVEKGVSSVESVKGFYANLVRKAHGRVGEVVWIQVRNEKVQHRKEHLRHRLVRR